MNMEASSNAKMSQLVSKIQLMKSDACPQQIFCAIQKIAMKGDSMGVLSSIPPNGIMIHNVRSCYMCKIGEVGNYKISESYENVCLKGILKDEFKVFERKGLNCAIDFPKNFRIKWIKIILSRIHDMKYWL